MRRRTLPWIPPLTLVLLLASACGAPPTPESDDAAPQATAWPQLETIPHPDLSSLEEDVRGPLEAQREQLSALLATADTPPEALAEALGRMGQLYHGYDLTTAALVCYQNATAVAPEAPRWAYLTGLVRQTTGDLDGAAESFLAALERSAADLPEAPVRLHLGDVELARHRPEAAREQFQAVLELADPTTEAMRETAAAAHYGLGRAAVAAGDDGLAVTHFEAALAANPEAGGVRYPLAQAYRKLGRREDAQRQLALGGAGGVPFPDPLAEAVATSAESGTALARRGDQALMAGELPGAIELYRRALEKTPNNGEARRNLALALTRNGDPEAAVQELETALQSHPDGVWLHFDLGNNYLALGQREAAIEAFRRSVELAPDFVSGHFSLANALASVGNWGEALGHLERVLALNPEELRARYQLAVAHYQLGRQQEGLDELEELVAAAPDFLPARQSLGAFYQQQGKRGKARRQFAAMLAAADNPRDQAAAQVSLATLSAAAGNRDQALAQLDRAIALDPELPEAHLNRATLLQQMNRLADAAVSYQKAAALQPTDPATRNKEGTALILLGRYGEARARLEDAVEQIPGDPLVSHTLARLLATAPEAAVRDGARALELAQVAYNQRRSLEHAETLAMAMAEQGLFAQAAQVQAGLLAQAQQLRNPAVMRHLQDNLERYQRGQPVRIEPPQ